jgi:hypothetical protein
VLRFVDSRFFAPAPAERLATVRVLTGAFAVIYLLVRANVLGDFRVQPGRFLGVGLAAGLSQPVPAWLQLAVFGLCVICGVLFTLGIRYRVSGPVFALLLLWVTSYRNSWGMVFHTDNLLVVHVIALAFSDAADALSWDARGRGVVEDSGRFGWPLRLIMALTALAYLLAAVAKLKIAGLSWTDGEVLRDHIAYDALRKSQIGSLYSPLAASLVQLDWPFPVLSWLTLVFELAGLFVLWSPPLRAAWAAGLWTFHLGVLISMVIAFPYPLSGIAFAALFRCERLWQLRALTGLRRWLAGSEDMSAVRAHASSSNATKK